MNESMIFNPAASIPEASAWMFALTRSYDVGTRGPKRSLVALAKGLGLDVDLAEVNSVLAAQIAGALGTPWRSDHDYVDLQVTLAGMNALLRAASENLSRLSRARTVPTDAVGQVLLSFPTFRPARNKQEAVNRLCDLAGVPHDKLGPGGKEHTWTLRDVARRLAPDLLAQRRTKHALAAALCERFSVPWPDTAGSTGASITLEGLNLLLAGAERFAGITSAGWHSPHEEAHALVDVLRRGLKEHWDGRECILEMRESGSTQWRQMEWQGFYFEEKARELLNEAYPIPAVGGPRTRYGNTSFDYSSARRVWDAKAHTVLRVDLPGGQPYRISGDSVAWLNDARAMRACIAEQGLGFLVADGVAGLDSTGEFREWHKALGAEGARPLREYTPSTGRSRLRKSQFTLRDLRALWIADTDALDASIAAGWIIEVAQPNWGGTVERAPKFKAKFGLASSWMVADFSWPRPGGPVLETSV